MREQKKKAREPLLTKKEEALPPMCARRGSRVMGIALPIVL